MKHFDVIVIGGGAGAKLAHSLSMHDYDCAVVDRDILGGTCLNHGCIPSKMLIHTAELAKEFQRASRFNLQVGQVRCAFSSLVTRVTDEVTEQSNEMEKGMKKNPRLTFFHHDAAFIDPNTLQVGKKQISADTIFLASGAHPYIPEVPGLAQTPYLTSREALRLKKRPSHLIIIGGGYIAAELGFYFSALGTEVTILARSNFLSKEDRDIRKEFADLFSQYVTVHTQTLPSSVSYRKREFTVKCKHGQIKGDQLLVATGMQGSAEDLGLENTKVEMDSMGFIKVNKQLRTAERHIFAFGDAVGSPFFRHKANFDAEYLLKAQFLSKKPYNIAYPPIPHAIFGYPSVAGVGKTEAELKRDKVPHVIGKCKYSETARGMAILPEGGFVKLIFEKKSKKLIGAHIVGEDAATLCHILSAFMAKRAKVNEIVEMIYIHPSLPEVIAKAAQKALETLEGRA
jgi:dihydrolipoamide dehydrogenase